MRNCCVLSIYMPHQRKPYFMRITCNFWVKKAVEHRFLTPAASSDSCFTVWRQQIACNSSFYRVVPVTVLLQCEHYFLTLHIEVPRDVKAFYQFASHQVLISFKFFFMHCMSFTFLSITDYVTQDVLLWKANFLWNLLQHSTILSHA